MSGYGKRRLHFFWDPWPLDEWAFGFRGAKYWGTSLCGGHIHWTLWLGPLEIMWLYPERATSQKQDE